LFTFETPYLDLEIYRLISILEASPVLAEYAGSESDMRKIEGLRMWDFPEVSRIVVSLAAIIRSSLDADPVSGGGYTEALERQVGTLFPEEGKPHLHKPLRFLEACNKILHAYRVHPETTAAPSGIAEPLTGRLILSGVQHDKVWRAELDLKKYALSALMLTP
jgi:hypothetical protein